MYSRQWFKNGFASFKTAVALSFVLTTAPGNCLGATVTTLPATGLTPTSATLNGVVNPQGQGISVWFDWGVDTNYGQATIVHPFAGGTNDQVFAQAISNLNVGQTYHFRAVASNDLGTEFGVDLSFNTPVFAPLSVELPAAFDGSVGWGDYDNDGRLDLLLTGWVGINVWTNTGVGFSKVGPDLASPAHCAASFGDHDNDGRLDIVMGEHGIWRNMGGAFAKIDSGLPGDYTESQSWGDYDNDGRPDILLMGYEDDDNTTRIWRNGGKRFFDSNAKLPGFEFGAASSADYDNDGDLDFVVCGEVHDPVYGLGTQLWCNSSNEFTLINAGLPGVEYGSVAWGDYDNDGFMDLVLSGYTFGEPLTQIWHNTGAGFANIQADLPGLGDGAVAWGDYDNDGRLDLLLTGRPDWFAGEFVTDVWHNTTNGFVRVNAGLKPTSEGGIAWGDYDNDGRLDIMLTGLTNGGGTWYPYSQIWHNEFASTNTPPIPPTNLTAHLDGNAVVFAWGSGNDGETPASGLTYNIRVGTTPGGIDLIAPMSLSNGFHQVPRMGNVYQSHQFKLTRVPPNQPIYWSVQSVDTAFAGSAFAPEMSLRVNAVPGPAPGPSGGDFNGDGAVDQTDLTAILRAFLTSNPPPIFSVSAPTTNRFQFSLSDLGPLNFTVLASTNLIEWEPIGVGSVSFDFLDADATNHSMRHYQLQLP